MMIEEIKEDLKEVKRIFRKEAGDKSSPFILAALTLFSGQFGKYNREKLIPAAASVELLGLGVGKHYPKKQSTVNSQQSNPKSSCSIYGAKKLRGGLDLVMGDYYYAKAIRLATPLGEKVIKIGAEAVAEVAAGELDGDLNQQAALHQAACEVGSLLAKVPSSLKGELVKLGKVVGVFYLSTQE